MEYMDQTHTENAFETATKQTQANAANNRKMKVIPRPKFKAPWLIKDLVVDTLEVSRTATRQRSDRSDSLNTAFVA